MLDVRFYKTDWERKMTGKDAWKKWKKETGNKTLYKDWIASWRAFRKEFARVLTSNPSGIDLPFFMGNISIRILDSEFKCAKDYLTTGFKFSPEEPMRRIPYTQDISFPKRAKYVWQKHPLFMGLAAQMGMEANIVFKRATTPEIRKNINLYQKAKKYGVKKSKCEDEKPKSLFD